MFRNLAFSILIILIVAGAIFLTADLDFNTESDGTRISTRNEVEVKFKPDMAEIVLGVETENIILDKAFKENNMRMDKIQSSLSEIGDIKIETLNFQVNPRKKLVNKEEVTYYHVSNQIRIISRNLENLSKIIGNSINSGANQILSINYSLQDEREAKQQVINKGIKEIKEDMNFIAQKMGQDIGEIISLTINDRIYGDNIGYRAKEIAGAGEINPMMPISVPDIRVSVNISAVFTIK